MSPTDGFLTGTSKVFFKVLPLNNGTRRRYFENTITHKGGSKEIKMDLVRHWEIVLGPISIAGVLEIPQKDFENYWPVKHCK